MERLSIFIIMNLKNYIALQERKWENPSYVVRGNGLWHVPSMLTESEKKMLSFLTEFVYSGNGKILDIGCFLGGSTVFLANGLSKNKNLTTSAVIDSFDLFKLSNYELNFFFPRMKLKPPPNLDTENMFHKHTAPFKSLVTTHKGNILDFNYDKSKIEVLFIDVMKSSEIYNKVIKEFFTHLIPLQSVVILQDYYYSLSGIWHYVLTYKLKDKLKKITDTRVNSNVLLCVEEITVEEIHSCLWENISYEEKIESVFHAYENCETKKQQIILKTILHSALLKENKDIGLQYNTLNRLDEKDFVKL